MDKCPSCGNLLYQSIAAYHFKIYGTIMNCSMCIGTFFKYIVHKNTIIEKLNEDDIREIYGFGGYSDYD